MEEKRTLLHCRWECKLEQPLWKTVWRILKKLKRDLPYDLAVLLLNIFLKKKKLIQKDKVWGCTARDSLLSGGDIPSDLQFPETGLHYKKLPAHTSTDPDHLLAREMAPEQYLLHLFTSSTRSIFHIIWLSFICWKPEAVESTIILPTSFKSRDYRNLLLAMSSHKTFRIKWFLAKEQKQHCPISQWIQMKTGNKIGTTPREDIGEESDWVCKKPCIWSAT